MGISLFKHNQTAYEKVCSLLAETGKAAVIHPTGTGKSFIAFKLCKEHPESKVCWLSPSEYIFETQVENLRETGADVPENIRFYTYAKLMYMGEAELAAIQPDFIILDEFHRCGAEVWGQGVQNLLSCYPEAQLLGLSATHIRYLDNQRDMAAELFDGNIAAEMSLGEAIVRGILNPPKYVLSVFSYQKDLERYQYRVSHARTKAVRDAANDYLEALRRALEKADGLDVIFDKHMTDRHGKYIVFCSNVDHLHDMMELAPEWFSKVDPQAHYYCAYSDNPETDAAFQGFKEDQSDHLKLLFCVDMLNEGIHVENISGVILLRPTVSPIIYKQQIGRALSASKTTDAVIFDIVLNIENLYSIGAIQEEIQIATTYYREHGMGDEIINDHFKVVDEVRDCIDLFNGLNETLSASWDMMYAAAKAYYEGVGDLDVPVRYMTREGFSLGLWVRTQRMVHEGKCAGVLTVEQIDKLNKIGMRWDSARDLAWEKYYGIAETYYEEFGQLPLTVTDRSYHGVKLERWLAKLRSNRKSGIQTDFLTPERIDALDQLGMVWNIPDFIWEQNYHAAVAYYKEHGNLKVPRGYVSPDGVKLGMWLSSTRRAVREGTSSLSKTQREELNAMGINWGSKHRTWEESYQLACQYKRTFGDVNIPSSYQTEDGYALGQWLSRQKQTCKKGHPEQRRLLEELGIRFDDIDPWEEKFLLVQAFYQENGHTKIPSDLVVKGVWLGRWFSEQVKRLNEQKLTPEQSNKLMSLGIQPNRSQSDIAWDQRYEHAKAYFEANGDLRVPRRYRTEDGDPLGSWVQAQRNSYNKGTLSEEHIDAMNQIGMIWDPARDDWMYNFGLARSHYETAGNLDLPVELRSRTGGALSIWLDNQRTSYRENKLSREQITMLDAINMDWRPLTEIAWEQHYAEAKEYFEAHGDLNMPNSYQCPNGFVLGARVKRQREHGPELPEDKKKKLDEIKMKW